MQRLKPTTSYTQRTKISKNLMQTHNNPKTSSTIEVKNGRVKKCERCYKQKRETSTQEDSKSDHSFKAEENENELFGSGIISPYHNPRNEDEKKVEEGQLKHFEREMNKQGLLDKITNIQHFNSYLELEIGTHKRSGSAQNTSYQETVIIPNNFLFPFHKRARSNSPPKNNQLFNSKHKQVTTQQPVIGNFLLGKKMVQIKQVMDVLSTDLSNDEGFIKKDKCALEDDWMYQRLDLPQKDSNNELDAV